MSIVNVERQCGGLWNGMAARKIMIQRQRGRGVGVALVCLAAIVAWPALAHDPVLDWGDCIASTGVTLPDPTEGEGTACYDFDPTEGEAPWPAAGYCLGVWPDGPEAAYAPMITWQLDAELIWWEGDPGEYYPDLVQLYDDYPNVLPATYNFCAWMDQLTCSLVPFFPLLPELEDYGELLRCATADINGDIDECFDVPILGNGIPDRYELEVLAGVLNDNTHPLYADALAAFTNNATYFVDTVKLALTAVEVSGGSGTPGEGEYVPPEYLDARLMSYGSVAWLIPSLAGVYAAYGTLDDPQTNVVLDELMLLFRDLGIEPPEGGVATVLESVPLGPTFDVNGNGYTGREIYEWFIQTMVPPMTTLDYADLVLNPAADTPPAKVEVTGGGNFAHNVTEITLTANVTIDFGQVMDYQWYEWGVVDVAPADPNDPFGVECDVYGWIPIVDETGSQLVLTILDAPFEGRYAVDVGMSTEDPVKATREGGILASADVTKDAEPPVPVGGTFALALFAGACAIAGVAGIRRRK